MPARRIKVVGRPNVYYRDTPKGRRYEIVYRDSEGRQRWQTIPGHDNLKEAEATLRKLQGRIDRGERVVPTRLTFNELADRWVEQLSQAPRTKTRYTDNLRLYLRPAFGRRRTQEITVDDVAALVSSLREKGLAGWSQRNVLTTLSSLFSWAVRRGHVATNPVRALDRSERPKVTKREQRVLERGEIEALLNAASDLYRPVLQTALYSGLRLMEVLGLRWDDVDLANGQLRVRHQLGRDGDLVPLKSHAGQRTVAIGRVLTSVLREHRLRSRFSQGHDFVFATATGKSMNWRNVQTRGFDEAAKRAGLVTGDRKPTFHDLRHTFTSLLISKGLDVVFISRQLGHSTPAITLSTYAHLFDAEAHADVARQALDDLETGNTVVNAPCNQAQPENVKALEIAGSRK